MATYRLSASDRLNEFPQYLTIKDALNMIMKRSVEGWKPELDKNGTTGG